ncbi:MAG TPA: hypothetical protein VFN15_02970 [Solirubrobacterales bacterium]|nr:hypothetical protein [Solirubrobacterales bacterium]
MVSQHVRSNVVGYLALFLALTGTASALQGKNSVKSKDIVKGAVTAPKIRGGAVTLDKIAPGVIDSGIIDGAVTTEKLADEAVTTAKLDDEAVTAGQIDDEAVTTAKIDAQAVTGAQLNKPSLALGPESFGTMPALRVFGELSQTAPAINSTGVVLDPSEVGFNTGGFGVSANAATVPISGIYYVRLLVPWGPDPAAADRMFVAQLFAGGDLIQTGAARATQPIGFNYGPSTEAAGVVDLSAGAQLSGEVYYSGTTPSGGIPLTGLGPTTLEAFWVAPS